MNNSPQPVKWNETCERYVAFIDIMGFKDMTYRRTHESILGTLQSVIDALKPMVHDAQQKLAGVRPGNFPEAIIRPVTFSDSILLVTNEDSLQSADFIVQSSRYVVSRALSLGIAVKGAIAHGKQTADFEQSLHFGRPLIDAYELQQDSILYAIVLHHSTEIRIRQLSNKDPQIHFADGLCRYETPFRSCTASHLLVRYDAKSSEAIPRLYDIVSGPLRRYADNTTAFVKTTAKSK